MSAAPQRLTRAGFQAALERLARLDPDMAAAMREAGRPALRRRPAGFASLVGIIVEQQISVAAGRTIFARLAERFDGPDPHALAAVTEPELRACGLTRQKAGYVHALARAVAGGELDLRALGRQDDAGVRATLTRHRGIGPWSADIYLMFVLGRPDIWPVGDLALQEGARMLKGLDERPDPAALARIGSGWQPLRSAAALVLWRLYTHRRAGGR